MPRCLQALAICSRAIITPGIPCMSSFPQPDSFGCLIQPATLGMQKWGFVDSQPIFYYGLDPRSGKTISKCSFMNTIAPEANGHPCPKPYHVWTLLLAKGSLNGETVLDPFMGSGTTLVAAKNLGRKAIGIEISREYCDIAIRRLQQEVFPFQEHPQDEYADAQLSLLGLAILNP